MADLAGDVDHPRDVMNVVINQIEDEVTYVPDSAARDAAYRFVPVLVYRFDNFCLNTDPAEDNVDAVERAAQGNG